MKKETAYNSHYNGFGYLAEFKDGFVFKRSIFNQ
jgi:hypothetical protein